MKFIFNVSSFKSCIIFQVLRTDFRRPRDVLLSTVADFVTKSSCRLIELYKKCPIDSKHVELLDQRCYVVCLTYIYILRYFY